ncbi:MAG TPA: cohesin domain-containing protein [Saprospiraceae bacterium]|nr:cohesin domain-containing protein [Saprospiraceae bacterium]HMQ85712.1 cohesin domain-containing protein [Saprospiraceae bacterium]
MPVKKLLFSILLTTALFLSAISAQAKMPSWMMPLELSITSATASVGEEVCLEVFAEAGFDNIAAVQFSVNWDPAILQFQSANLDAGFPPGVIPLTFGTTMAANGLLAFSWGTVDANGFSLPSGGTVFTLCFQVLATTNSAEVFFSDNPTFIDIYNSTGMPLEFVGNPGLVQIQSNQAPVQFHLEEVQVLEGATFCLPIQVNAFQGVSGMSFVLSWDAALLEFISLDNFNLPGLDEQDFQLVQPDENAFQVNWASANSSETLANGSALFEICFQAVGQAGQSAAVNLMDVELENDQGQSIGVTVSNGAVIIETEDISQSVGLIIGCETGISGQRSCIEMSTLRFTDVTRLAFSIRWSVDSLSFLEVSADALPFWENMSLNTSQLDQGFLGMEWEANGPEGSSLPDGAVLFSLCFESGSLEGSTKVRFSSNPVSILIEKSGQSSPFVLEDGKMEVYGAAVWPGDATANGRVDQYDVLLLGLAFGAEGAVRPEASLNWQQQAGLLWEQNSPSSMVNFVHADSDGNGVVQFSDIQALSQNFGLLIDPDHPPLPLGFSDDNSDVMLQMEGLNTAPGEVIGINLLLGDALHQAESVYGLAFELKYDPEWLDAAAIQVSFLNSWLGTPNNDLLTFVYHDLQNSKLHIAFCRNDGIPRNGSGSIAQLSVPIKTSIPQGLWPVVFQADRIRMIDEEEQLLSVANPPVASFIDNTVASKEVWNGSRLHFFPNPVQGQLSFRLEGAGAIQDIRLFSAQGQFIQYLSWKDGQVKWPDLTPALYWIVVKTADSERELVYPLIVE